MPNTCAQPVNSLWAHVGTICVHLPTLTMPTHAPEQVWCAKTRFLARITRIFHPQLHTWIFARIAEATRVIVHTIHSNYYIDDEFKKGE